MVSSENTVRRSYGLVRYGTVPEVARFAYVSDTPLERGTQVVVQSHRGQLLGTWLESAKSNSNDEAADDAESVVLRLASELDQQRHRELAEMAESQFMDWTLRIRTWNLNLELIDLELTLDDTKTILYVLAARGPDCTKLALQAAAAGLGVIEVQPVSAEGLISVTSGSTSGQGGCGTGGCGCGH